MRELSHDHDLKAQVEQLSQDHQHLTLEHQALIETLTSERAEAQQKIQDLLDHYQLQRDDEKRAWSEKSKGELVKFQRDSDELYQRCSESFDEIHDGMESAQEKLKASQAALDDANARLSASIDENLSREAALQERLLSVLETRLKETLDQFELVKVAINRLTDLNLDLKSQVKSHSAAIKELEEHRDQMIARRVVESYAELADQVSAQIDELQRAESRGGDLVAQVDALRRELSEEKRKQNMNVIIAALVGVVGWFF